MTDTITIPVMRLCAGPFYDGMADGYERGAELKRRPKEWRGARSKNPTTGDGARTA